MNQSLIKAINRIIGAKELLDPFESTGQFKDYVKDVQKEFQENQKQLLQEAKAICPETVSVELGGSFKSGNPREDSDVDLMVYYNSKASPEEIHKKLSGRLHNDLAGTYDIVPIKVEGRKMPNLPVPSTAKLTKPFIKKWGAIELEPN